MLTDLRTSRSDELRGAVGSEVVVDSPDFNLFKTAFGSESDIPAGPPVYDASMDFNLDGFVDAVDFGHFKPNFGSDWAF